MKITEIRRDNLRKLKAEMGVQTLAKKLNRPSSFLSQVAGPNPTRDISEKNARDFEESMGFEPGFLDRAPETPTTMPPLDVNLMAEALRQVAAMCDEEKVSRDKMDFSRLADLAALVLTDAVEHGGQLREDHTRRLVRLLK